MEFRFLVLGGGREEEYLLPLNLFFYETGAVPVFLSYVQQVFIFFVDSWLSHVHAVDLRSEGGHILIPSVMLLGCYFLCLLILNLDVPCHNLERKAIIYFRLHLEENILAVLVNILLT